MGTLADKAHLEKGKAYLLHTHEVYPITEFTKNWTVKHVVVIVGMAKDANYRHPVPEDMYNVRVIKEIWRSPGNRAQVVWENGDHFGAEPGRIISAEELSDEEAAAWEL